ncbi:Autophagy- protein 17 [Ophidiomyces ophidiicola]|nr:Autophagy- protein 17 [Ophidiomyces ophidiicola]
MSRSDSAPSSVSDSVSDDSHLELETEPTGQQPNLETLVAHLVAAKRSLSSINHVWRANEIVTSARSALQESVILFARAGFLHRENEVQLRTLYQIKDELEQVAHYGRDEFSSTLKELDGVGERLRHAVNSLHETKVELAFVPAEDGSKTLHDFVDENAVHELQSLLRNAIDKTSSAQADLGRSNTAFDDDLDAIQRKISNSQEATKNISSSRGSPTQVPINQSSPNMILELLHSLESHAQEMAHLLESLVHHFDLCATAVKHTEGGGAAALRVTGDLPRGLAIGGTPGDDGGEVDNHNAQPEPLTESDYQEILSVIIKDAAEAEDVVLEIQDRVSEMEITLDRIFAQRHILSESCTAMVENVRRLDRFSKKKLPKYIAQSHIFLKILREQHENMRSGMSDLSDLQLMYVGFLNAYDDLILEVARRKTARSAVERVIQEAEAKLDKLYEDDVQAREAFRLEQGDYLPSDIWPGLGRAPMRVEFKRVFDDRSISNDHELQVNASKNLEHNGSSVEDQEAPDIPTERRRHVENAVYPAGIDSIPNLPKQTVENALVRRKARIKSNRASKATYARHD